MPDRSRKRICITEDNRDLRVIFSTVFETAGFEVCSAEDGMQALRLLYTNPPDILILDINLPGISGLDVLKHLREETQHRALLHLKIIVVTGNPTALMTSEAALADLVLMKPIDVFELLSLVRRMLPTDAALPHVGAASAAR